MPVSQLLKQVHRLSGGRGSNAPAAKIRSGGIRMDPYDTAATRAVWDRVLRTQEEPEEATIEDVLRARIAAEKTNRLTYLALARCAGRAARADAVGAVFSAHRRVLRAGKRRPLRRDVLRPAARAVFGRDGGRKAVPRRRGALAGASLSLPAAGAGGEPPRADAARAHLPDAEKIKIAAPSAADPPLTGADFLRFDTDFTKGFFFILHSRSILGSVGNNNSK